MKLGINRKFFFTFFGGAVVVITAAFGNLSCTQPTAQNSVKGSPTEAYRQLYAAVKAKNSDAIRAQMSKQSLSFADGAAKQQNITLDKVIENGFTATTFAATLPEIRDERVKDKFGAVEVYNSKESKWEDLPFVAEDGAWKLAIGDLFANTFKSPGKGRAQLETEAANAQSNGGGMVVVNANSAGNFPAAKNAANKAATNPVAPPPPANAATNARTK